jgi:hypothetical protein
VSVGRHRAACLIATILAAVVAGCAAGPLDSPPGGSRGVTAVVPSPLIVAMPTASPAAGPVETPTASDEPAVWSPSAVATLPGQPPHAVLHGLAGGKTVGGWLGSFTWDNSGTDAPWIVGRRLGSAKARSPLTASFDGLVPASWTASWVAVDNGVAADSGAHGTAGTGAVAITSPVAGDWSLQIVAVFGPGTNAVYYWHLAVTP